MKFVCDLFRLLLTSGFFVALCAVALALETSFVAGIPRSPISFYAFVLLATWSSYRVHALAAKPTRRRAITTGLLLLATLITVALLPRVMLPWVAVAAGLSILYSLPILPGPRRLRDFGIAKILVLTGVWTLVTAYLPAIGQLDPETLWILLVRRFLFMFALCIAFDVRDHVGDARDGVRTLPVRVGVGTSYSLMRITLVAFAALILLDPIEHARQPTRLITTALLISTLFTWLAIERSRRAVPSNLYYLGCIDGMMAVQGLLVAAAKWMSSTR